MRRTPHARRRSSMNLETVSGMTGVLSQEGGDVRSHTPAVREDRPTGPGADSAGGLFRLGERYRGVDVGEVGEGLGEVPQKLPALDVVLLAEEPEVVRGRARAGEYLARLLAAA